MRNLVPNALKVNALQERYAGQRIEEFQRIVEENDLYRWACEATERPLRPDTEQYSKKGLLARLKALIP